MEPHIGKARRAMLLRGRELSDPSSPQELPLCVIDSLSVSSLHRLGLGLFVFEITSFCKDMSSVGHKSRPNVQETLAFYCSLLT